MIPQEYFGQTTQQNVAFEHHRLKKKSFLCHAENSEGFVSNIFYCLVNNFHNHMLIIITAWMPRFPNGDLQMPWYLISKNAEKLLLWWIMPNTTAGLLKILQQYTWEKTIWFPTWQNTVLKYHFHYRKICIVTKISWRKYF